MVAASAHPFAPQRLGSPAADASVCLDRDGDRENQGAAMAPYGIQASSLVFETCSLVVHLSTLLAFAITQTTCDYTELLVSVT